MNVSYCTQSDLTRFTGNMKYPLPSRKATAIKLGKGGNGFVFAIFHNGKEYAVKKVKGKVATYVTSYVCSYTASSLKSYMGHDWVYTYIIVMLCYCMFGAQLRMSLLLKLLVFLHIHT